MTQHLDIILFVLYLIGNIGLGLWVARKKANDARGYFLAGDRLPWYAIGGSIIASNISTEHFIGMVGIAYVAGFVVAEWEWGNWFTFTILMWVFLPYFIRGGLYTMPEFLERRFNPTCRYLFAVCSLVLWIVAQMSVIMLAGAKAMKVMFGLDENFTILAIAILAGSYTIYGGLIAVAWTDFLQFIVMLLGGLVVALVGLNQVGGLHDLMLAAPEKFKMVYPHDHQEWPWFGLLSLNLSVGIWYNCTNQFIVQRCLGARSEWDARMGVLFAGFVKILMPLLVVIPGIIAFRLFPDLIDKDRAWPTLVRELIPVGLSGIVMAGLASGVLAHVSSVLNSCSTVFTMDLYKPFLGRNKSDLHMVRVGRFSAFGILVIATLLAFWFTLPRSFSTSDFPNLPGLVTRLTQDQDVVSQYLTSRLSDQTRQRLSTYNNAGGNMLTLKTALAKDFNVIIRGPSIYDEQRFAGVKLSTETSELIASNPKGSKLTLLNRLLLESAYPHEIAAKSNLGIFDAVQKVGMWVAAPVAAVFLVGVMWGGATAAAATFVLIFGFPFTWFVENILFKKVTWLLPYDDSYGMNRTFIVWLICIILLVVVSWFTKKPDPESIKGIIWSWQVAKLPESERVRNRGIRSIFLWWAIFMLMTFSAYAYVIWFQFWGPGAGK